MAIRRSAFAISLVLLAALASAACDGEGGPNVGVEPPPSAPGPGTPIRGMERLAWDQTAASFQRLRQYAFRLYIDGTPSPLAGAECLESSTAAGFPCSAALPQMSNGTHTIQLAAVVDGVESARSSSLIVTMSQGRAIVSAARPADDDAAGIADEGSSHHPAALCVAPAYCFDVHREVTRQAPLSQPAVLPDGRLLFVEDERRVRIRVAAEEVHDAGVTLNDAASRILALLVDPFFDSNRFVRVAWIDDSDPGGRALSITRYREVDNRLGEPAAVIASLPIPGDGDPHVVQDDRGRIYIAVRADGRATRERIDHGGELLRFAADGRTWAAGLGAPGFARAFVEPDALAFDRSSARLWLTGRDHDGNPALQSVALGDDGSGVSTVADVRGSVVPLRHSEPIVGLIPLEAQGHSLAISFLAVGVEGRVWPMGADGAMSAGLVVGKNERVVALHAGTNGSVYAITRSTDSPASFRILRLAPRSR